MKQASQITASPQTTLEKIFNKQTAVAILGATAGAAFTLAVLNADWDRILPLDTLKTQYYDIALQHMADGVQYHTHRHDYLVADYGDYVTDAVDFTTKTVGRWTGRSGMFSTRQLEFIKSFDEMDAQTMQKFNDARCAIAAKATSIEPTLWQRLFERDMVARLEKDPGGFQSHFCSSKGPQ